MKKLTQFRHSAAKTAATLAGVTALAIGAASAQTTNAGVDAIVDAIDGLKPDMSSVVIAAIGLALIGIGAAAAISLGKRLMGK